MMGRDAIIAHPFRQIMGDSFHQPADVHEKQSGAILFSQLDDPVVNLVPHFVSGDGTKRAWGSFQCEIERALVTDVYDDGIRAAATGEEVRDFLNGLLG